MNFFDYIDCFTYIYYIFAFIALSILIYRTYYKYQYDKIHSLGNNKFLYIMCCWIEEIVILFLIIPGALLMNMATAENIDLSYPTLNNSHKDLLIASLTVFSITTAISLICISFEKNLFSKLVRNDDSLINYDQRLLKSMLYKIKLFSSGYKHLWLSTILIAYTLWLLLCLSDNTLNNGEMHYFIWCKLIIVNGVSFIKTLIEFSFLSRDF